MIDPSLDHLDPTVRVEPWAVYERLRAECPVMHRADHDPPFYVVTRHEDVGAILRDDENWRNREGPGVLRQLGGVLGSADDPDHARQRAALRPAFLPTVIARLEPRIAAIADECFDAFVPLGEGDFVTLFAFPFPAQVIAELLGIPVELRDEFGRWASIIVATLGGGDLAEYERATGEVWAHVDAEVERRLDLHRAGQPLPVDAVSTMVVAHLDGRLSREEIRRLGHQLLVAGHETTSGLLGLLLYRLIERPEVLAAVRADRSLVPAVVEEALRFDSPVQGLFRTNAATCPIGDVEIPAGSKVQVMYASANRDHHVWPDADAFRVDRDPRESRTHLAFGWGLHYCIGAPLARMEIRLALDRILDQMHDIELTGPVESESPFVLRGLSHLPIRWRPATVSSSGCTTHRGG